MKKIPSLEHKSVKDFSFSLKQPNRNLRKTQLMIMLMVCTVGLLAFIKPMISGLNQAEPMGLYLNGNLPANVTPDLTIEEFIPGDFDKIMSVIAEPRSSKMYITNRFGKIFAVDENNPSSSEEFLDISSKIWSPSGTIHGSTETGIFIMTFHPEFNIPGSPNRNYFYIYYVSDTDGKATTFLSRFTRPDGATIADPNSELVLIKQYVDKPWHRGGGLMFGNDGFLYQSIGDFNKKGWTQRIDERFVGGVIRIDVDMDATKSHPIVKTLQSFEPLSFSGNYFIPNDNPWVDPTGGTYEEFYAIGFRNPHRMTLDTLTGNIFIGNVGRGGSEALEEVDQLFKGANYGWPFKEGSDFTGDAVPSPMIGNLVDALYSYPHANGENCVIGGQIYRGITFPNLYGKYIFGDYGSSRIYALDVTGTDPVEEIAFFTPGKQATIAIGHDNELYFANTKDNQSIYKMVGSGGSLNPPHLLSQTGVFSDINNLITNPGVIPYTVNTPLWSDDAAKKRWIAIPNDGTHDATGEQVDFSEMEEWEFPVGTVLLKHFELHTDENNPASIKRLETRFLVHADDGTYYGMTYKWLPDGSDAELLAGSFQEDITIATANGGTRVQTWNYPSRSDCFVCHTDVSGRVLGLKTRQQNGDLFYPSTGTTGNQLESWNHIGIFNPTLVVSNIPGYLTSKAITDTSASVEFRVRSYLDANCSSCHRPGGAGRAEFDLRLNIPLASQRIINEPVYEDLGIPGAAVVVPQDTGKSILYQRLKSTDPTIIMPPLGRTLADPTAKELVAEWIMNMAIPNRLPIADIAATPVDGISPLLVSFDASGSSDPDNNTLSYSWDFGDSSQDIGLTSTHTYTQLGSFLAILTVDDGQGGVDKDSITIVVGDGSIVVTPLPNQTNTDGESVVVPIIASGGHGALAFSATGLPTGLTIDPNNGNISGIIDPAASNNSPYAATVMVDDSDADLTDQVSINFTWTVDTILVPQTILYRLNTGGTEITAIDGEMNWGLDGSGSNSQYLANNGSNSAGSAGMNSYHSSVDPARVPIAIYDRERSDNESNGDPEDEIEYIFPNFPNGAYEVRLYMGNAWGGSNDPGERIFSVQIEESIPLVYKDIDLADRFGHKVGAMVKFVTQVSDGNLNIRFLHGIIQNPLINGIEILDGVPGSAPITVASMLAQATNEGQNANITVTGSGGTGNLTYSAAGLPAGATINPANGLIGGAISPGAAINSPYTVVVSVDDSDADTEDVQTVSFVWTINTAPLPVEWLSFTANEHQGDAILDWVTASELNNEFFEVQRSVDGRAYQTLGKVESQGNSHTNTSYRFVDKDILSLNSRTFLYRLKQVDFDGVFSYSPQVEFSVDIPFMGYPVPFTDELNIRYLPYRFDNPTIKVISSLGQTLFESKDLDKSGNISLDTSKWPTGIYFIRLQSTRPNQVFKVIKE